MYIQGGAKVGLQLWVHDTVYSYIINYCIIFHTNNCNPTFAPPCMLICFFKILFIFRGREGETERNINVREKHQLALIDALTKPTTQACALTENETGNFLLCRMTPTGPHWSGLYAYMLLSKETDVEDRHSVSVNVEVKVERGRDLRGEKNTFFFIHSLCLF